MSLVATLRVVTLSGVSVCGSVMKYILLSKEKSMNQTFTNNSNTLYALYRYILQNFAALVWYTAKLGPMGFYKGFVPSFVRLAPLTILTWIFFEQLRLNFGREVPA